MVKWTLHLLIFFIILLGLNCSSQSDEILQGYIEGQYTYISSSISGTLFTLNITRGQEVQKGALLFTLDPEPDKSAMEAAQANVGQLEAEVLLAKKELDRYRELLANKAVDRNTFDQKQSEYDSKNKQLQYMQKNLAQSTWAYHEKIIYSPVSGRVYDTFYRVGEKVAANQPVLAILTPDNIKVLFYIPERKLTTIHLNQPIYFSCDGCGDRKKAIIRFISSEAEYTPPIIYSEDTRYKLVYLVRADLDPALTQQLHPGQPLDIYFNEK